MITWTDYFRHDRDRVLMRDDLWGCLFSNSLSKGHIYYCPVWSKSRQKTLWFGSFHLTVTLRPFSNLTMSINTVIVYWQIWGLPRVKTYQLDRCKLWYPVCLWIPDSRIIREMWVRPRILGIAMWQNLSWGTCECMQWTRTLLSSKWNMPMWKKMARGNRLQPMYPRLFQQRLFGGY